MAVTNKCGAYSLVSIIDDGCLNNIGGLRTVYAIESTAVTGTKLGAEADANKIDEITVSEGGEWKKFTFRKNTSNMTSTSEINDANGTCAFTTKVALKFSKANDKNRQAVMGLVLGGAKVVVEDSSNHWWYLGRLYDVTATVVNQETGTAYSDFAGYSIELQDVDSELPRELTEKAIAAVTGKQAPVL